MCPKPRRLAAWDRLARELPLDTLDALTNTVALSEVADLASGILAGKVRGRTVIEIGA
jgi:acrylyl-CoA reductase (NADPH)